MATTPVKKRTRLDPTVSATLRALESEQPAPPVPLQRSRLESLPVELLSEILGYMPSPNDILNVTRTSSYLCHTLLNKGNVPIWVTARKNCTGGTVPEPPAGWSEPAHAAFIFDGGNCEECGHYTKRMLVSYAVQARLCGNNICRKAFFHNKLLTPRITGVVPNLQSEIRRRLPFVENIQAFGQRSFISPIFNQRYYRRSTYQDLVNLVSSPTPIDQTNKDEDIAAMTSRQEHFAKLGLYRNTYEKRFSDVKTSNIQRVHSFSNKMNWAVADVMRTPTIKAMLNQANRCMERMSVSDLDNKADVLKQELNVNLTKRERGMAERASQQRRADVVKYYNTLKSQAHTTRILPPPQDFRHLPFILHLLGKDAPSILEDLRADGNSMDSALQSDLNAWVKKHRKGFERLLGYDNWRDPNPTVLSPTERINARFHCVRCGNLPRKLHEGGSFNFVSACAHECADMDKRTRQAHVFTSADFQADLKGKASVEGAARLANVDLSVAGADEKLNALGVRFLCKSCPGCIVMPFSRLSGHALRHDAMEIELLDVEAASAILDDAPYERGAKLKYLNKQLGSKDEEKRKALGKLKAECRARAFFCRHCHTIAPPTDDTNAMRLSNDGKKPFMIDGMVCHLKSRHNIEIPGDEDFFRVPDAASAPVVPAAMF